MDLTALGQLTPYVPLLRVLGYRTVEQLRAAAAVAGPQLDAYLGNPVASLLAGVPVATASGDTYEATDPSAGFPLGVALDHVPPLRVAPGLFHVSGVLPAQVSHVAVLPPIRDQGEERRTCVAFAALASFEHALRSHGDPHDLSEQFAYWNSKRHDGLPSMQDTWLGVCFPALRDDGVCDDELWAYDPQLVPGNVSQAPPPPTAIARAAEHRPTTVKQLAPTSVIEMKAAIAGGRCVAVSVRVFPSSFHASTVVETGDIPMPVPGESGPDGHALCLVGYADDAADTGGGRFIVRNSWGPRWGKHSPHGSGYGTMPYEYVTRFGTEAWYAA